MATFSSLRMSPDDYAKYWKTKWDYTDKPSYLLDNGSGTLVVTGYDDEATTVIQECGHAVDGSLRIPFNNTDTAYWIRQRIQDKIRVKDSEWELVVDSELIKYSVVGNLPSFWRRQIVDAILIPRSRVKEWQREHPDDAQDAAAWKLLQPGQMDSVDPVKQAAATWHLTNQDETNPTAWAQYSTERHASERKLAELLGWQEWRELRPLMQQIKYGAGQILKETTLDRSQIFSILDGVMPQSIDIRDEDGTGEGITDANILSRIYSPTNPTSVEVRFEYRCHARMNDIILESEVAYRIVDSTSPSPAQPAIGRLSAGSLGGGWRSLFNLYLDPDPPGKRWYRLYVPAWDLTSVDVDKIQTTLLGPNGPLDKVQTIRLLLASVGILLRVGRTEDEDDRCNPERAGSIQWGWDYDDWIAFNIRKSCGVPLQRDATWKPRQFQNLYDDSDEDEDGEGEYDDDDDDEEWSGSEGEHVIIPRGRYNYY